MTDEREEQVKKELLWEYTKTLTALEAFRVGFRNLADKFDSTAKVLRTKPETLASVDFSELQNEFESVIVGAREYSEMLDANAVRKGSLIAMGVLS